LDEAGAFKYKLHIQIVSGNKVEGIYGVINKSISHHFNIFSKKVLSMLHHPNIIEYCDSFAHEKSMMIVMEFAAGGTLFDLIEARVEEKVKNCKNN